jgi:enoyl-CoA hydratase/carnithine racemase
MTDEWQNVLSWLKGHPDDVRVVIVTGSGSAFCAGDDVKELASLTTEEVRELSLEQAQIYLGFESLPQVVIGAINGDALGAGCVCAVACDMRIAGQMARFGMPEIALGWAPGYGIAQLTALVGKARALKMCLTAEPITAKQALDWGLVNEVVPQNQLMERARAVSERLLSMPPIALRETKNLIHADEGPWTKSSYVRDTEAYMRCLMTDDAKEGIKAFKQKRQPNF